MKRPPLYAIIEAVADGLPPAGTMPAAALSILPIVRVASLALDRTSAEIALRAYYYQKHGHHYANPRPLNPDTSARLRSA